MINRMRISMDRQSRLWYVGPHEPRPNAWYLGGFISIEAAMNGIAFFDYDTTPAPKDTADASPSKDVERADFYRE